MALAIGRDKSANSSIEIKNDAQIITLDKVLFHNDVL